MKLFATVGENFETMNVVGVVLTIRGQADYLSVWMRDSNMMAGVSCGVVG